MADDKKLCFVIGPIGVDDSDDRIHADWLLEGIILPVMDNWPEFRVERADGVAAPGLIDAQVIKRLLDADLVIADLSKRNPNAFYEIGIRHVVQKPIIHMQDEGETLPFDVSLYRAIKFSRRRPQDLIAARKQLTEQVAAVLAPDYVVENPVTLTRGLVQLREQATPGEQVLLEQVEGLNERVRALEVADRISTDMLYRAMGSPPMEPPNPLATYYTNLRPGMLGANRPGITYPSESLSPIEEAMRSRQQNGPPDPAGGN